MALYFITGSKNKFEEVKAIVDDVEQFELDLTEIQEIDAHKVISTKLFESQAALKEHKQVIVEDTSLYLDALNGLPGPLIKWFMKTVGNEGLYKIASAFGNFGAEAKTIIGYTDGKKVDFFEGVIKGSIVEPRGETTFGWDPIFIPEGYTKTFAEMSPDEKNAISMRKIAAEKLKTYLYGV
jgi:non-canonical purine NTP pyrophosphatase (RdgB/HAM1 family)